MRTWVQEVAFHDHYLGYEVDVAVYGDDDGAAVGGTAEVDVAVFGDDDDAAVGGTAEVDGSAVGDGDDVDVGGVAEVDGAAVGDGDDDGAAVDDGDDADAAVDETVGLACTCVDKAVAAVEELDTAVGKRKNDHIEDIGVAVDERAG